nr:MAG TPA: hypothetical protein [Caudoviricetes sp.]
MGRRYGLIFTYSYFNSRDIVLAQCLGCLFIPTCTT